MSTSTKIHQNPHIHAVPTPITEVRDPILEDDHFSLRYGNPIKVIHDIPKHKLDTFEPSKEHVPGIIAEAIADTVAQDNKEKRAPLTKSNSGVLRDSTLYSEYVHNKDGSITEIDHDK